MIVWLFLEKSQTVDNINFKTSNKPKFERFFLAQKWFSYDQYSRHRFFLNISLEQ